MASALWSFVYIMGPLRTGNGSFAVSLLLMSALLAVAAVVVSRLKDAPLKVGATAGSSPVVAPANDAIGAAPVGPDAPPPPAPVG